MAGSASVVLSPVLNCGLISGSTLQDQEETAQERPENQARQEAPPRHPGEIRSQHNEQDKLHIQQMQAQQGAGWGDSPELV